MEEDSNHQQATRFATNFTNVYVARIEAGDSDELADIFANSYAERMEVNNDHQQSAFFAFSLINAYEERRAAGDNPQQAVVYAKRAAR